MEDAWYRTEIQKSITISSYEGELQIPKIGYVD
jgi:hypothetical protein